MSRALVWGALLLIWAGLGHAGEAPTWRYPAADRVVAISDIHGADEAFVATLRSAGVIDGQSRWAGGTTRLVIVGDVLDRGPDSRGALDLIRRLEREAPEAGGAVHLVLGNHEVMNLTGDLRYVSAEEYAAFAAEETPAMRDAAFTAYAAARAGDDPQALRATFDGEFPPGFFAHRAAFAPDGEYGAWLLGKPALVVIGDTAFVHGGLPASVAELGGEAVNARASRVVRGYLERHAALVSAGVLSPTVPFYDQPHVVDDFLAQVDAGTATCCADLAATARELNELYASPVFDSRGVMWYRGTAGCPDAVEDARLDADLGALGTHRVVIGHTPHPQGVRTRLGGRVIRVDTGMLKAYYGGEGAALVLKPDGARVIYQSGTQTGLVPEEAGVPDVLGLSRSALEEALVTAPLSPAEGQSPEGGERRSVTLSGRTVGVDFIEGGRDAAKFLPDVAAYRLDRLLGLGMVPVTVPREVDGHRGSLRLMAYRIVPESERMENRPQAYCPLRDQYAAMYVFDALMANARAAESLYYVPGSWALVLLGEAHAFGTSRSIPRHLQPVVSDLDAAWRRRLEGLSKARLEEVMGDVLDGRRIAALLKRRDAMLD